MATILKVVYASAPTDNMRIITIEIKIDGLDPIRVAHGFKDWVLGVDGEMVQFEQGSLSVSLPARNTTGQQNLRFGVSNATGRVQEYVDKVLADGIPAQLIYREYLISDLTEPASRPLYMEIRGGEFEGGVVQIEASYYDLLNARWPRDIYTQSNAPGLKYL